MHKSYYEFWQDRKHKDIVVYKCCDCKTEFFKMNLKEFLKAI